MLTMYVSLVACLMLTGVATADPVVYNLTATSPTNFGGTITVEDSLGFNDGTEYGYSWGDGITDFSIFQPNSPGVLFTGSDMPGSEWSAMDVVFLVADDTAVEFFCDVDDSTGTGALFGTLEFGVASQEFDTQGNVEGAALTRATPPAGPPGSVLILK